LFNLVPFSSAERFRDGLVGETEVRTEQKECE